MEGRLNKNDGKNNRLCSSASIDCCDDGIMVRELLIRRQSFELMPLMQEQPDDDLFASFAAFDFRMGGTANAAARLVYDTDISWIAFELVPTEISEHAITKASIDGSKVARRTMLIQ
mmetsp:Transcript_23830/g.34829  ORF Transcript_23830/g.34829 Transcript_23830/m.34829 type:complete len:117 (-) Transcript_23830:63-413(-)